MVTTLWANGSIRVETGFLALFIAFVIKSEFTESSGFTQLLLLGLVGAAAGIGGFIGNGLGARLPLTAPETTAIVALGATLLATVIAILAPGLVTAAVVGLVGSTGSSLAKVCLDSVIQHELPEASRASAFGRSETVLQLSWVFGGVVGLLIGGVLVVRARQGLRDRLLGRHRAARRRAGAEPAGPPRQIAVPVAGLLEAHVPIPAWIIGRADAGHRRGWRARPRAVSAAGRGLRRAATSAARPPPYSPPPGPATTQWAPPVGPPSVGPPAAGPPPGSPSEPPPARREVRDAHKAAKNRKKA